MNSSWLLRLYFPPDATWPAEPSLWLVSVLIPLLGGLLTFLSIAPSATAWRKSLIKSRITPPQVVVAAVWVVLYIAMGHAAYLVYSAQPISNRSVVSVPLVCYMAHVLLNHFYIIVLFGLRRVDLAFAMIFVVWATAVLTALLFYEVDAMAGELFAYVVLWVTFNVYLNFILVRYNSAEQNSLQQLRKGKVD